MESSTRAVIRNLKNSLAINATNEKDIIKLI